MTPEEQDKFVLKYLLDLLGSDDTKELEQKIANSEEIVDSSMYIDVDKFRQAFTCIVLLKLSIQVDKLHLYMLMARTMQVPFLAELQHAHINIDKGGNFFFIKVLLDSLLVSDLTGYPNTNTKPWITKQPLTLVRTLPKDQRTTDHSVRFYYSSFPT